MRQAARNGSTTVLGRHRSVPIAQKDGSGGLDVVGLGAGTALAGSRVAVVVRGRPWSPLCGGVGSAWENDSADAAKNEVVEAFLACLRSLQLEGRDQPTNAQVNKTRLVGQFVCNSIAK